MILLSVDPGVRACGVGLFYESRLIAAGLVVNPIPKGQEAMSALEMARAVERWRVQHTPSIPVMTEERLAIECPRVYDAAFQKGDQNTSIVPLTLVVGAIAGRVGCRVTQYFPRDWKGTIDGDEMITSRIMPAISKAERDRIVFPAPSLAHNVWDGIGVGLKFLGRLEPRRVFHRES